MLSIGKMVARSGEYYIATVAHGREEYYTGSGESPGFWLGEGARRLGLEGAVDPDDLRPVLAGISPDGEILTAGRVDEAKRVAGFDLTWSAPKSVSLLFGLSDPAVSAVVRGVHEDAVDQALGYLERHALSVRRGAGGQTSIRAEGLVAAAFTHRTSRAGDPQLHTHVLVANVAKGVDGIWSAPSSRLLYNHSRTAGFLYQAALRGRPHPSPGRALRRGVPGHGRARGRPQGVAAGLLHPPPRDRAPNGGDRRHLGPLGRSGRAGHPLGQRRRRRRCHDGGTAAALAGPGRRARLGTDGGTAARSTTRGRRGLAAAEQRRGPSTARSPGRARGADGGSLGLRATRRGPPGGRGPASGIPGGRCRGAGRSVPRAFRRPRHGERRTRRRDPPHHARDAGSRALPARRRQPPTPTAAGAWPIERTWSRPSTTSVCSPTSRPRWWPRLTSSGAGVEVVVGKAGAGKTLALAAARMSWESSGYRVLGTALSARAARGLRDGAGIDSQTLASLLAGIESGRTKLGASDVVVLDEAGMVGTRALARLVESADDAGAKVVLVGDPRQLPEIEAGGALAGLIERVGAVELTENRRQQSSWERVALDALRMGRAKRGPGHLRARRADPCRTDHGRGAGCPRRSAGPSRSARAMTR